MTSYLLYDLSGCGPEIPLQPERPSSGINYRQQSAVGSGYRHQSRAARVDEEEFREVGLHGFVLLGALLALFLGVELRHEPSAFDTRQCHGDTSSSPPGQYARPGKPERSQSLSVGMEKPATTERGCATRRDPDRQMDPRGKRAFTLL